MHAQATNTCTMKHAYLDNELFLCGPPGAPLAAVPSCAGRREAARTAGRGSFGASTGYIYDDRCIKHIIYFIKVHRKENA